MEFIRSFFTYDPREPMLFTHMYFWLFFAALMVGYVLIYKKNAWRNAYLFLFSLFFYWKSGGHFFTILIFSTIVDYSIGRLIYTRTTPWKRKWLVSASVVVNLGLLAYFKYPYFLTGFWIGLFGASHE